MIILMLWSRDTTIKSDNKLICRFRKQNRKKSRRKSLKFSFSSFKMCPRIRLVQSWVILTPTRWNFSLSQTRQYTRSGKPKPYHNCTSKSVRSYFQHLNPSFLSFAVSIQSRSLSSSIHNNIFRTTTTLRMQWPTTFAIIYGKCSRKS